MAADYTGNPIVMDTGADAITDTLVQQIVWVSTEAAGLVVSDQLTLTINGTACNCRVETVDATSMPPMALNLGPWTHPILMDITVTLIEGGAVWVFVAPSPPESKTP